MDDDLEINQVNLDELKELIESGYSYNDLADYLETTSEFYINCETYIKKYSCLTISPDSKYLILGSYGKFGIIVWSIEQNRILYILFGHSNEVISLFIDSDFIYSSSSEGELFKWVLQKNSQHKEILRLEKGLNEISVSSDKSLLFGSDLYGTLLIIDLIQESLISKVCSSPGWNTGFIVCEKYKTLVTGSQDNIVRLWDYSGNIKALVNLLNTGTTVIEKSLDDEWLAVGSYDNFVLVIKSNDSNEYFFIGNEKSTVFSIKFLNQGKHLAYSSSDRFIKLWDIKNKTLISSIFHTCQVFNLILVDQSKLFALSKSGEVIEFDDKNFDDRKINNENKNYFFNPAATRDGKFIIGVNEKSIIVYNVLDRNTKIFQGHEKELTSLKIVESLNLIITSSNDNSIKLWNMKEKSLITTLNIHRTPVIYILIHSSIMISLSEDKLNFSNLKSFSLDHSIAYRGRMKNRVSSILLSKNKEYLIINECNSTYTVSVVELATYNACSIDIGDLYGVTTVSSTFHNSYIVLICYRNIHVFKIPPLT